MDLRTLAETSAQSSNKFLDDLKSLLRVRAASGLSDWASAGRSGSVAHVSVHKAITLA